MAPIQGSVSLAASQEKELKKKQNRGRFTMKGRERPEPPAKYVFIECCHFKDSLCAAGGGEELREIGLFSSK